MYDLYKLQKKTKDSDENYPFSYTLKVLKKTKDSDENYTFSHTLKVLLKRMVPRASNMLSSPDWRMKISLLTPLQSWQIYFVVLETELLCSGVTVESIADLVQ